MRELTSHKVNGCNESIRISVVDGPGDGGASHKYWITLLAGNPRGSVEEDFAQIEFQNGPIAESGVNGITHEALLAILEDRLVGFQSGKFACEANADALHHIRAAQSVLKNRTVERVARGVEGTHQR